MRKIIIVLFLLFSSSIVQSQIKLLVNGSEASNVTPNQVLSNTDFNLGVSVTTACPSLTIVINKGNLIYNPSGTAAYGANVTVTNLNATSIQLVMTVSASAGNQVVYLPFKFGVVCQGTPSASQTINAQVSGCSTPVANNNIVLQAKNNLPTLAINLTGSSTICRGNKPIGFKLLLQNPQSGSPIQQSSILKFQVPECTTIPSSSDYTISTSNPGFKEVVWTLSTLDAGEPFERNISINLNCDSCPDTPSFTFQPKLFYLANNCTGNPILNTTTQDPLSNINYPAYTFSASSPGLCYTTCSDTGPVNPPNIGLGFTLDPFKCPNSGEISEGKYRFSVGENLSMTNLEFISNIPEQTTLTSFRIPVSPPLTGCVTNNISISYLINNGTTSTWSSPISGFQIGSVFTVTQPAVGSKITKVKWIFSCTITASFDILYVYNYLPGTTFPPPAGLLFNCNASYKYKNNLNVDVNVPDVSIIRNVNSGALSSCLDMTITNKVRPFGATSDFVTNLTVVPNSMVTYLMAIKADDLINLTLLQEISNQVDFISGSFRYAFGSSVNNANPSDLNFNPCPSNNCTMVLGTSTANFNFLLSQNSIQVSSIDFPPNNNNTLYIMFDATLKNGLIYNSNVSQSYFNTRYTINQSALYNQTIYSNNAGVRVSEDPRVSPKMYARCVVPNLGEWTEGNINVRNNEKIDFKIEILNTGSVYVDIEDIQNLKPMLLDNKVGYNTVARGSNFTINYDCTYTPLIETTSSSTVVPTIQYSNTGVDKIRELCTIINGSMSNWLSISSCSTSANWLRVLYSSNNKLRLQPGEKLTITYRGKVSGATVLNASAKNSFNAKLQYQGGYCPSLLENILTITNDGKGCSPPCIDCTSFGLTKKEKYLVSGWVREEDVSDPNRQFKTYEKSYISLRFMQNANLPIGDMLFFYPSGEIIDGWQRIVGEFMVPDAPVVEDMILELANVNRFNISYFDDIRILPSKGNMKSFVYDQRTQRLMAELDENNYSTFYEYDLEGGLIRIKKETEKGVFTIQETRSGSVKTGN